MLKLDDGWTALETSSTTETVEKVNENGSSNSPRGFWTNSYLLLISDEHPE